MLLSLHDVISSAVKPESILQLQPSMGNALKFTCHGKMTTAVESFGDRECNDGVVLSNLQAIEK